jgi:hypothetical protein
MASDFGDETGQMMLNLLSHEAYSLRHGAYRRIRADSLGQAATRAHDFAQRNGGTDRRPILMHECESADDAKRLAGVIDKHGIECAHVEGDAFIVFYESDLEKVIGALEAEHDALAAQMTQEKGRERPERDADARSSTDPSQRREQKRAEDKKPVSLEGAERHPQKVEAAAQKKEGRKKKADKDVAPLSANGEVRPPGEVAQTGRARKDMPDTAGSSRHEAKATPEVDKTSELRDRGKAAKALCDRQVGRRDVPKIVDFLKSQIKAGR